MEDCAKHNGQWQLLRNGKRICLGCLEEKHDRIVNSSKGKLIALYHAVNVLMNRLGADGEINATQSEAEAVMTALYDIDGGCYESGLTGKGNGNES